MTKFPETVDHFAQPAQPVLAGPFNPVTGGDRAGSGDFVGQGHLIRPRHWMTTMILAVLAHFGQPDPICPIPQFQSLMFGKSRDFTPAQSNQAAAEIPTCSVTRPFSQRILGIWRVGQTIARGGDTELLLAQPADAAGSPRWDYVLKTLSPSDAGTPTPLQATRRIAQSIAAGIVKHPNLVPILDSSASGTCPYLVMPRLHAEQLGHRISNISHFALPVALWWTRQIAQSVDSLHRNGWIHGDIQPANVLVDSQGHATLIDLGSATKVHAPMQPMFRGTPNYASPELTAGKTAALPAMDIFSLGRILWECLARTEPTEASRVEPVAELIEQMLAPEPTERPCASTVVRQLLNLEIDTLGCHIVPAQDAITNHRAA